MDRPPLATRSGSVSVAYREALKESTREKVPLD
jgi:hypothetical protein